MLNEVTVLNIREYLAATENGRFGEEELKELLSEFSCSKRNESQSEEIAKTDSIAKSSITETPGKAPEKGSAGSFLRPIPGDKSATTYSFLRKCLRVLSLPLRRIAQGILLHPFSTLIIEDKQDRCNGPGQWIGKCHCCDLVSEGDGNGDPEDPQDTDPKAGQQHREKGIPAAAAGTGKDFDTDVSDVGGRNDTHHADADVDDIGIACE